MNKEQEVSSLHWHLFFYPQLLFNHRASTDVLFRAQQLVTAAIASLNQREATEIFPLRDISRSYGRLQRLEVTAVWVTLAHMGSDNCEKKRSVLLGGGCADCMLTRLRPRRSEGITTCLLISLLFKVSRLGTGCSLLSPRCVTGLRVPEFDRLGLNRTNANQNVQRRMSQ